jgi:hypothetical protein
MLRFLVFSVKKKMMEGEKEDFSVLGSQGGER